MDVRERKENNVSHVAQIPDDDLLSCYTTEEEVISDVLPGNYTPTPSQWLEVAAEIIRAVNRYRYLKCKRLAAIRNYLKEKEVVVTYKEETRLD